MYTYVISVFHQKDTAVTVFGMTSLFGLTCDCDVIH